MVEIIENPDKRVLNAFLLAARDKGRVAVDIETNGLDPFVNDILLFQVAVERNNKPPACIILHGKHLYADNAAYRPIYVKFIHKLAELCCLIGHNIQFDVAFLRQQLGVDFPSLYCTRLVEANLNLGLQKRLSLDVLAKDLLGIELNKKWQRYFIGKSLDFALNRDAIKYAAYDVAVLFPIVDNQQERVQELADSGAADLKRVNDLENDTIMSTVLLELNGVKLDLDAWDAATIKYEKQCLEHCYALQRIVETLVENEMSEYIEEAKRHGDDVTFRRGIQMSLFQDSANLNRRKLMSYRKAFKFNSYREVLSVLEMLGVTPTDYHGNPTTSKNALYNTMAELKAINARQAQEDNFEELERLKEHEINSTAIEFIDNLLAYKKLEKLLNSFLWKSASMLHPVTGRLHHSFIQMKTWGVGGTVTGRYASKSPNAQQYPAEGWFRHLFVANEGHKVLTADYGSLEIRIAANLSRDEGLVNFFVDNKNEGDFHGYAASLVFDDQLKADYNKFLDWKLKLEKVCSDLGLGTGVLLTSPDRLNGFAEDIPKDIKKMLLFDLEHGLRGWDWLSTKLEVNGEEINPPRKDLRTKVKQVNYGILYGLTPAGLAPRINVTLEEAEDIINNRYKAAFPKLMQMLEYSGKHANRTLMIDDGSIGRMRHFDRQGFFAMLAKAGEQPSQSKFEARVERQAKNFRMQATNANMVKLAANKVRKQLPDLTLLLTVHDELVTECPIHLVESLAEQKRGLMVQAANEILSGPVQYTVGLNIADSWVK